jgi:membrane fusion protein, heavy metal efflux system
MSDSPNQAAILDSSPIVSGAAASQRNKFRSTFFGRLCGAAPALLVFTGLGAVLTWGHHTGWTMPKFSALADGNTAERDDWCAEHNVPESQCVECNPALLPRPRAHDWCKRHGVHECPLEHPDVAQLSLRPKITAADFARAERALDLAERPENNPKCKLHERRIQFLSKEAVDRAGIDVEPVWTAPVTESVTGNGEVAYDQTRMARLSARVPGTVFRVYKQTGDRVAKGELLALVDAVEVGKAKSELLQALVQVRLRTETTQRLEELRAEAAVSEAAYRSQAAALSEARIRLTAAQEAMTNLGLPVDLENLKNVPQEKLADRLRFLGLPESVAAALDPKKTTGNLLAVTAPLAGIVVARQVVEGEVVNNAKTLFVVVDTRQMWLTLDLRLEDAKSIALDQQVRFRPDGGSEARGKITWISTEADRTTRTLKVRASLDNHDGRLRANTFGAGKVILREESQAIVVPNSALHWEGCCHIVFVRDKDYFKEGAPKVFHVRTVRPGARDEKQTEIIAGLLPGEIVATRGSAALRAQLLKGNLGEG